MDKHVGRGGRCLAALVLAAVLALGLAGCQSADWTQLPEAEQAAFQETLDLSLGQLADCLSEAEYETARQRLLTLWPLRRQRLEKGEFEPGRREQFYLLSYSRLLDGYTEQYLGRSRGGWYEYPEEVDLVNFRIQPNGILTAPYYYDGWEGASYERADAERLWTAIRDILPEEAFSDFEEFHLFTDGDYETLAYVYWDDTSGVADHWGLALDPADSDDWDELVLTVLHEYCHYLTLREGQVTFLQTPDTATYCEDGMRSAEDSYLNAFYQSYWGFLYEERRQNPDSTAFFTRHGDRFCDEYAATDPAEDIAESFSYYVVMGDAELEEDASVRGEKLNFFQAYPEFSAFRAQVRANLGLDADEDYGNVA